MQRTLSVKRLYSLGQFKNITFENVLSDIPEEMATNEKIVQLLYTQQYLACEIAYRNYYNLVERISKEGVEDVLEFLENERNQTLTELYEEIKKTKENPQKET